MKILFKFPTRSRPEKFFAGIKNITDNVSSDNYQIVVSCDSDDASMRWENIKERFEAINNNKILIAWGLSDNKIHAVNRDVDKADPWGILVVMSDDMAFQVKGFDDIIRKDMVEYFPDGDGFLHYNDGNQKSNVSTMSIMGRKYYDRTGYIYHPGYSSVWCDVEATEVAYMLGKHKYMGDEMVIFRHLHPAWGLSEYDDQYRKTESLNGWGPDLQHLINRKENNYGIVAKASCYYDPSKLNQWKQDLNNARVSNGLKPYFK